MGIKTNLLFTFVLLLLGFIYSIFLYVLGFEAVLFSYTPQVYMVILALIFWQLLSLYRNNCKEIKDLSTKTPERIEAEKEKLLIKILRDWRHDFLNHLQIILTLVQLKKYSRQVEYINEMTDSYREIGKILHIKDAGLSLFLLNKIQELKNEHFNLELVVETDLHNLPLPKERFKEIFTALIDLLTSSFRKNRDCFVVISEISGNVKLYFNFYGGEEDFDKHN